MPIGNDALGACFVFPPLCAPDRWLVQGCRRCFGEGPRIGAHLVEEPPDLFVMALNLVGLRLLLRTSPDARMRRLDALRQGGLIAEADDGSLLIVGAVDCGDHGREERREPQSPAERTRRWRERRDGARDVAGDAEVTAVTPLEEETAPKRNA